MNRLLTIRGEGGSRVITVTKVLPKKWQSVEIEVLKETAKSVTLKINKVR